MKEDPEEKEPALPSQSTGEAGKPLQKCRDYVVEDGDIINFLFNV